MGDWSLGSVASAVQDFVPDVPTAISGTRLLELADRKRQFVQEFTGTAIGSNGITIQHQSPILKLTIAETVRSMNLTGADVQNVKLGDFSVGKGAGGNLDIVSRGFEEDAMKELKALGQKLTFFKANG